MKKYITFISSFIVLCCLLGCTDEQWLENGNNSTTKDGLPVEFIMDFATNTSSTRGIASDSYIELDEKTSFKNGDIIQIVANFYKKGNETTEYVLEESVCCILTYEKGTGNAIGKWVNSSGESLLWPWDSEYATFQAFYYPGFNGLMNSEENPTYPIETDPVLLESLELDTDPLMAEKVRVNYGNAVNLTFKHIYTRLVVTDLDAVTGSANYTQLWLENKSSNTQTSKTNAFYLQLNQDETTKALSFKCEFKSIPDDNNKVLIGGKEQKVTTQPNTNPVKAIVFFLPEGDYSNVALTRRFGRSLLEWEGVTELNQLESQKSYRISLKDMLGNITLDDDEDWWEDEITADYITPEDGKFDLAKFLECAANGHPYSYYDNNTEIVVLEEIEDNYIVLKQNINFNNQSFTPRNVDHGITFDGNGHFFKNVNNSVFNEIRGHVLNLGITQSTATVSLTNSATNELAGDKFGLLARVSEGQVDGIRLSNITINISSLAEGGTYMIGALVGENNTQSVTNIEVTDNIKVQVGPENIKTGALTVGGLTGQNGKGASLESVTVYDNAQITVKNKTKISIGSVYTGGLVGLSSSDIRNCKVQTDVDASEATGTWVYTGGLAGSMRTPDDYDPNDPSKNYHIKVENSQNIGKVIGGICLKEATDSGTASGHSSTGGLVGYSLRADIENCLVSGTVSSEIAQDATLEYYTIGGVAGAVRAVTSGNIADYPQVKNNNVYATVVENLTGIDSYSFAGWLAGIAPTNIIDQQSLNQCFVQTVLNKVGRVDDSTPTDQSGSQGS